MSRVLILRPQPAADRTAAWAKALGLEATVAPLFTLRRLDWAAPGGGAFDAVLITSANAARLGGDGLTPFLALPCYAVGDRSAEAARARGFADLRTGGSDAAALVATMADEGVARAFHPCGRDHVALDRPSPSIASVPVYAADAVERLPASAEEALALGAVALLHSPRAAATFAALAAPERGRTRVAAISAAAAAAAGTGWRSIHVAPAPNDAALLELAAKLCQTAAD